MTYNDVGLVIPLARKIKLVNVGHRLDRTEIDGDIMAWEFGRASDEQGLRLVIAFLSIAEPDKRMELIRLAEAFAAQSQPLGHERVGLRQDNSGTGKVHVLEAKSDKNLA